MSWKQPQPHAPITVLDGAMGTELEARGVVLDGPAWSARANIDAPHIVSRIHADYLAAGATVHTTNTFRTTPRALGSGWRAVLRRAVALCRAVVGPDALVAGSVAPLEDCWHPERSPPDARPEHTAIAEALADTGVDLILCETFSHMGEAMVAVECALATGLPVWVSFTSGPFNTLSTPLSVADGARRAVERGVSAVLVNCIPAVDVLPYLHACTNLGVPLGVRANAGAPADGIGYGDPDGPERYLSLARQWVLAGATRIGGCCGTGPAHIRALADGLHRR